MTARKKPQIFRPLQAVSHLTMTGGYTTKKYVPQTRKFSNLRGGGEGADASAKEVECVMIGHREPWLCEITTGKSVFERPLARVRIIRELYKRLARMVSATAAFSCGQSDKQMEALAIDSDDSESQETPKKKPNPKGGRFPGKRAGASAVAGRLTCHAVSVPQHPSNPHAQLCVGAAMDERGRLWLQVDCLTWLAEYIKAEKESGGVAPLEESEEAEPRVQWNFQHSSWQALAVSPDGTKQRRERCVKARQKAGCKNAGCMNFVEAKETLYRETLEWLAAVEGGMPPPQTEP